MPTLRIPVITKAVVTKRVRGRGLEICSVRLGSIRSPSTALIHTISVARKIFLPTIAATSQLRSTKETRPRLEESQYPETGSGDDTPARTDETRIEEMGKK